VLAPPKISTVQPSQQSEKALFGKTAQKKAPFFAAFEGLLKQLQKATGMEKQTHSKDNHVTGTQKQALQNVVKKTEDRLHASTTRNEGKKWTDAYLRKSSGVQKANVSTETEKLSSILLKDAETVQKKQNLTAKGSALLEEASPLQGEQKKKENVKNSRLQGMAKESDAVQDEQVLAVFNSTGVLNKSNKMIAEKSEEGRDSNTKKTEKSRDRRKERIDVEVYDLRTETNEPKNSSTEAKTVQDTATKTVELTLHLKDGIDNKAENSKLSSTQSPSKSFQDMLTQELRNSMNGEIVRHASMVLKNGGEGLIRLNLKPESLGNVRIKLEMADNKLTGHILVESEEALRAFEKEIHSLEQAFKDGGFQGASLEVSVSADGRGSGSFQQWQMEQPFYSEKLVASTYNEALPELLNQNQNSSLSSEPNISINMLA